MFSSAYVWAKILNYIEEQMGSIAVSTWFDDADVISLTEENLIIYSPSDFRRDLIRQRCADHIHDALKKIFNSDAKLLVLSDKELEEYQNRDKKLHTLDFNPQFSFDTFVVGASNQLAHGAALVKLLAQLLHFS